MSDYTKLKFSGHIGDDSLLTILENNLKAFYDWGLLHSAGAWVNVGIPTTNAGGGNLARLRYVADPSYTAGKVWEAARKDWVYETGVNYVDANGSTQNPSGVGTLSVNNVASTGTYNINYPLGRIILDTAIATGSTVQLAYTYRAVQIYVADQVSWWEEMQTRAVPESSQFLSRTKGDFAIGSQHRIQMPAIVIEAVPRSRHSGYELGNSAVNVFQDVLFRVFAETRQMRNKLIDIIRSNVDKNIWLMNTNTVANSGDNILDEQGYFVGSKMYPALIDTYYWKKCYFTSANVSEMECRNPSLFGGIVRVNCEVTLGQI